MLIVTAIFGNFAHATDYPANITGYTHNAGNVTSSPYSTGLAACQAFVAYNVAHGLPNDVFVSYVDATRICNYTRNGSALQASISAVYSCGSAQYIASNPPTCRLTCASGTILNQQTGTCDAPPPPCVGGQVVSAGYYDVGTSPTGSVNNAPCINGCSASFDGISPASRSQVLGVWHYYAKGTYTSGTINCSPNSTIGAISTPPANTCGSGQVGGTVNGVFVCVNQSTGQPSNPNTAQTASTSSTSSVTNADGSTTKTTTETKADGSTNTTVVTTASNGSSTTTQTSTAGTKDAPATRTDGKTQGAKDVEDGTKEGLKGFCTDNPESPMCKQIDSGAAAATTNLYVKKSNDQFYKKDADLGTFSSVLEGFTSEAQTAPFYSQATSFFEVSNTSAGSCSGLNQTFNWGNTQFNIDLDSILCGSSSGAIYDVMRIGMQLGASFLAFSIAFLF